MAQRKSTSKFASQAALEALVRFGPEISGLLELQRQARGQLGLATRQARGTAASTQAAIARATPELAKVYDDAGLTQAALSETLVGKDLAGLAGPGSDFLQGAGALEAAAAAGRLNSAKTRALADLADRSVRASEGQTFQVRAARDQFTSDLAKILSRRQSLLGEKGAFEALTLSQLEGKQVERQFTATQKEKDRRNARDIAAGHDATSRANARDRANNKGKGSGTLPGGAKPVSKAAHNELAVKIDQARDETKGFIARSKELGKSRAWIARVLRDGIEGHTVHDPDTGRVKIDKNGAPVKEPGMDPVPALIRRILLDQAFEGGLTRRQVRELHRRGYRLRDLGLRAQTAAEREAIRAGRQVAQSVKPVQNAAAHADIWD